MNGFWKIWVSWTPPHLGEAGKGDGGKARPVPAAWLKSFAAWD